MQPLFPEPIDESSYAKSKPQNLYPTIKRGVDIVASAVGLVVLALPLGVVAFAVKADSPGPAIFKQERLGLYGKPFTMYKFRSMTVGAEAGGVYEAKGDVRVTRVGHIIRKTSIDELPQLLNILKGDMSFVGPRPTLTYHPWPFDQYTPAQKRRFDVRPGITGLAQISGRKGLSWSERLKLDAQYVDTLSPIQEARIVATTVWKVLRSSDNINVSETGK